MIFLCKKGIFFWQSISCTRRTSSSAEDLQKFIRLTCGLRACSSPVFCRGYFLLMSPLPDFSPLEAHFPRPSGSFSGLGYSPPWIRCRIWPSWREVTPLYRAKKIGLNLVYGHMLDMFMSVSLHLGLLCLRWFVENDPVICKVLLNICRSFTIFSSMYNHFEIFP